MNPEVLGRWERCRVGIAQAVAGADRVIVRIPGWPPVGLDEGLEWCRINIYEGFFVAYLAEQVERDTVLWLKVWEFGCDEPEWSIVKALPIRPPTPKADFW
jgi:hypothetical protein